MVIYINIKDDSYQYPMQNLFSFKEYNKINDLISGIMYHILTVEITKTSNLLLKSILESKGYKILNTINNREAYKLLKNKNIDLIIADLMDTYKNKEKLKKLLDRDEVNGIPVFVLTPDPFTHIKPETKKVNAYIPKPIDINLMIKKIETVIQQNNVYAK